MDAFWWAERWGWTPDQVDALPVTVATRLPLLAEVVDEVREEKRRRDERR